MKLNKKNKGITLVALVITIIILLILAGITINSLTGNGLFEKTRLAKEKYENAEKLENETLGEYKNTLNEYINGSRLESPSGKSITLFDGTTDEKGVLTAVGIDNADAKRSFNDDVNKYDAVVVSMYYYNGERTGDYYSFIVDKSAFNKSFVYYFPISPSNAVWCYGNIKIDTTNNSIIYLSKGYAPHTIYKVSGINY